MVYNGKVAKGKEFVFSNGAIADSVVTLKKQMKDLNDEEFTFHVNQDKNDFYNWIRDCIDNDLAEKIDGILDKDDILKALD